MNFLQTININGELIDLSVPKIMGIINVTPDSFYSGSRQQSIDEILKKADQMINEGAAFLDIGGYSSRPGADHISPEEELKRVIQPIEAINREFPEIIISIDTFRASVAKEALDRGAQMINDISGGDLDPKMFELVQSFQVPYILMHMRGTPQNMKERTEYADVVKEIIASISAKLNKLTKIGVNDILVDPGFGFAKTVDQNFEILSKLEALKILGRPLLVGLSRKSMIYKTLNVSPEETLNGTTVVNTLALLKGASILRVHDVKEASEAIELVKHFSH